MNSPTRTINKMQQILKLHHIHLIFNNVYLKIHLDVLSMYYPLVSFYILFLEPIQSSKFVKPQIINFTTNNPYVSNLNKLMGDLAYKLMALILVQWVSNTTKHMGLLFVVVMSQKLIVLPVLLRQDK